MKFETKWKGFKWVVRLTAVISGVVTVQSIMEGDYTLFIAGLALGVAGAVGSVVTGFMDAMLKEAS